MTPTTPFQSLRCTQGTPAALLAACAAMLVSPGARAQPNPSAPAEVPAVAPAAPAATPAAAPSAALDFDGFQALFREQPPAQPQQMGAEKFFTWLDHHRQKAAAAGLAFFEANPADPRRWTVLGEVLNAPPLFAQGYGPDIATKGPAAIIVDKQAKAEWDSQADGLRRELIASTDAPPEVREQTEWFFFARDFRLASAALKAGRAADMQAFQARFEAQVAKYPQLEVMAGRASDYLGALESVVPGSAVDEWRRLLNAPNMSVRSRAEAQVKKADLMAKPLDIAFTAADGSQVDLANLRGKVVLVDFWATWCGPCRAELPNVVANYGKYHDKGFEVVGIALENGHLSAEDTPEAAAGKLASAKQALLDFTKKNAMPWPQYFDGKFWKTDVAVKYNINSIPAMFLLDQKGVIVTTNARGEMLESEVRRLLGL